MCLTGTNLFAPVPDLYQDIDIYVDTTWQIPYASDVQDLCFDNQYLVIRSNIDKMLYLADPTDCSLQGYIQVPACWDGFGVAFTSNGPSTYYVNSNDAPDMGYYDESDTWSHFSNPAGTSGAGMNFNWAGGPDLYEASAVTSDQFYGIEPDGTGYDTYPLAGVTDEISGFMPHGIMTDEGYPPGAAIVTTRLGHEFFFYHQSGGGMTLYGQEPCPIPVIQSLGLAWNPADLSVYWSYQGLDSLYCVAKLFIPVFGSIEDEAADVSGQSSKLSINGNPAQGSANFTVNMTEPAFANLDVYDVSGRLVETVQSGQLPSGMNSFSFEGSPGLYIAVLRGFEQEQSLKFILTR